MVLTGLELLVAVLCAYRLTRAVAVDDVSLPLRERLATWASNGRTWRRWLHDLISCPLCSGWWVSIVVYVALVVALDRWGEVSILAHAVAAAAVAGGQCLLALLDALLVGD